MLKIDLLPAREGDCIWITYGDPASPRYVLIDGGRKATSAEVRKRLNALGANGRLELLIISHIDRDHIEGVLALLEAKGGLGVTVGDVWFNAYHHLLGPEVEPFGATQGERLSKALSDQGLNWNEAFGGGRVCIPDSGALPRVTLDDGLELTILSPTPAKLAALRPVWAAECAKAGLAPGATARAQGPKPPPGIEAFGGIDVHGLATRRFDEDGAEPNGSSIAVLARYDGKSVLLAADAHPSVLTASLKRLSGSTALPLAACKLSHHGSARNTSTDLLELLKCTNWLISTNGSYFKHPDKSAVARVLKQGRGAQLHFNYRTDFTAVWDDEALRQKYGYETHFPPGAQGTISVEL